MNGFKELADLASSIEYDEPTEADKDAIEEAVEDVVEDDKPAKRAPADDQVDQPDDEQDEDDGEESPDADEDADEESADEEESEGLLITVDNKELRIPKGTPPEVVEAVKGLEKSVRADYTRKTMEVADERRALEAMEANRREAALELEVRVIQQQAAALEALTPLYTHEQLDRLAAENAVEFNRAILHNQGAKERRENLKRQFEDVDARLAAEKEKNAKDAKAATEAARKARADRAWALLQSDGFTAEDVDKTFRVAAKNYGMTEEDFGDVLDAPWVAMMRDANKWRNLQERRPATEKRVNATIAASKAQPTQRQEPKPVERRRDDTGRFKRETLTRSDLARELSSLL